MMKTAANEDTLSTMPLPRKKRAAKRDDVNFIVLLARQRSGTNALRSVLHSHPDIFCLNEIMNPKQAESKHALLRKTNFFYFLKESLQADISRILPHHHEELFKEYLDHLRHVISKRYIVVDVKFNTTHFLSGPYKPLAAPPHLFTWIEANKLKVFVLTRKNYLRYAVSQRKAQSSGVWQVHTSDSGYADVKVQLNVKRLLKRLEECYAEEQLVKDYFSSYAHYLCYDYADIFEATGKAAGYFLRDFSKWLGIPNSFNEEPSRKKLSRLPLEETIANFEEVAEALRGTKFEYCLEDERMYSSP